MLSTDLERLPAFQSEKAQIAAQLRQLSALAEPFDAIRAVAIRHAANDLDALAFNVAVIGEFNRGKTTLVNALIGRPGLLRTAPLPNTAAITRLTATEPGEAEHYRIVFRDPSQLPRTGFDLGEITTYANEALNATGSHPSNQPALVEHVELFLDSDFLRRNGIVLIDTPGLGAISRAHQDVTERIIPTVHAALFVFMVDPPLGAAEVAFLQFSQAYISRFLFVMNDKHDTLHNAPAEAADVLVYARHELAAAGIEAPLVICLNPGAFGRGTDGGFAAFWPTLADFLIAGRGRALLSDALRKAEQHISALDESLVRRIADAARQTVDLYSELSRLQEQTAALESRQTALLARVDDELRDIVTQLVADIDGLAERIDRSVGDAIDKAGIGALRVMHLHLSETIRQTVYAWLRDKSAWINARCTALYRRVLDDLRALVAEYEAADLTAVTIQPIDLPLGVQISLGGDVALALATGLGIAAGVALVDVLSTGGIGAVSLVVGGAAGSGTAGAMLMQRVRSSLKITLHKPLPAPNQAQTALSALIEGYVGADGQPVVGLRTRLSDEFSALDEAVKAQIIATVADAWQPRFSELSTELARRTAAASSLTISQAALSQSRTQLAAFREIFRALAAEVDQL